MITEVAAAVATPKEEERAKRFAAMLDIERLGIEDEEGGGDGGGVDDEECVCLCRD